MLYFIEVLLLMISRREASIQLWLDCGLTRLLKLVKIIIINFQITHLSYPTVMAHSSIIAHLKSRCARHHSSSTLEKLPFELLHLLHANHL